MLSPSAGSQAVLQEHKASSPLQPRSSPVQHRSVHRPPPPNEAAFMKQHHGADVTGCSVSCHSNLRSADLSLLTSLSVVTFPQLLFTPLGCKARLRNTAASSLWCRFSKALAWQTQHVSAMSLPGKKPQSHLQNFSGLSSDRLKSHPQSLSTAHPKHGPQALSIPFPSARCSSSPVPNPRTSRPKLTTDSCRTATFCCTQHQPFGLPLQGVIRNVQIPHHRVPSSAPAEEWLGLCFCYQL